MYRISKTIYIYAMDMTSFPGYIPELKKKWPRNTYRLSACLSFNIRKTINFLYLLLWRLTKNRDFEMKSIRRSLTMHTAHDNVKTKIIKSWNLHIFDMVPIVKIKYWMKLANPWENSDQSIQCRWWCLFLMLQLNAMKNIVIKTQLSFISTDRCASLATPFVLYLHQASIIGFCFSSLIRSTYCMAFADQALSPPEWGWYG